MAAPLSQDLRRRLVQAIEAGSSAGRAAARFAVSPTAVHRLMRRVRATGSTMPARVGGYRKPCWLGTRSCCGHWWPAARASPWHRSRRNWSAVASRPAL